MALNVKKLFPLDHPYVTFPEKSLITANENSELKLEDSLKEGDLLFGDFKDKKKLELADHQEEVQKRLLNIIA